MIDEEEAVKRAALSALNSIRISKNIVEWRAPRPLVARFLDRLTGKDRRLEDTFDSHVANALEGLHGFVGILRDRMAESDVVLAKAISTLKSVRTRVQENTAESGALRRDLAALEQSIRLELDDLWREVEFAAAVGDLELTLSMLDADRFRGVLCYTDIWLSMDQLWWGRVGRFLRKAPQSDEAARIRNYIAVRLRNILIGHGLNGVFSPAPLLERVQPLLADEAEQMQLLALEPTWVLRPLTSAVLARSVGTPDIEAEDRRLTVVTTGETIAGRMLAEAERGTK